MHCECDAVPFPRCSELNADADPKCEPDDFSYRQLDSESSG